MLASPFPELSLIALEVGTAPNPFRLSRWIDLAVEPLLRLSFRIIVQALFVHPFPQGRDPIFVTYSIQEERNLELARFRRRGWIEQEGREVNLISFRLGLGRPEHERLQEREGMDQVALSRNVGPVEDSPYPRHDTAGRRGQVQRPWPATRIRRQDRSARGVPPRSRAANRPTGPTATPPRRRPRVSAS